MVPLAWYLVLAAVLFIIGLVGVLVRRSVLIVLMSLELMLNSVNINLLAFSYYLQDIRGQVLAVFVITITAAEVAVALAIVVAMMRNRNTLHVDQINLMSD